MPRPCLPPPKIARTRSKISSGCSSIPKNFFSTTKLPQLMNIDVHSGAYRCCDGLTRRSFLRTGALMLGGLSLTQIRRQKAMAAAAGETTKNMSVILFWQGGGPSQLDMWDL